MKATREQNATKLQPRRPWQPPTVTPVGTISSVLQGGAGKVTVITGDPGEPHKVPGMDK